MEWIAIVTLLALFQFFAFTALVGRERGKHGVKAPAISGHPEFERAFRVQQNTMEQLIVFLPSLWLFGLYVSPTWGAGIGLVFLLGRFVYRAGYMRDPAKRHSGFVIGTISVVALLLGGLFGAISQLI